MFKKTLISIIASFAFAGTSFAGPGAMTWQIQDNGQAINALSFPLRITQAKSEERFYFAYQFNFTDARDVSYIGVQPAPKKDGKPQFRVLFSSFRPEAKAEHKNCSSGADYGTGVSCATVIDGTFDVNYTLSVVKEGNTLTGTINDPKSGKSTTIGKWCVSPSAKSIANYNLAWIENYSLNAAPGQTANTLTCDSKGWPYYEVTFGAPVGNNGQLRGTITELAGDKWDDANKCPGVFTSKHDSDQTTWIGAGYKSSSNEDEAKPAKPAKPSTTKPGKPGLSSREPRTTGLPQAKE